MCRSESCSCTKRSLILPFTVQKDIAAVVLVSIDNFLFVVRKQNLLSYALEIGLIGAAQQLLLYIRIVSFRGVYTSCVATVKEKG